MKKVWLLCLTLFIISQSLSIAGDGSGTMTIHPTFVVAGSSGLQFALIFTSVVTYLW